MSSSSNGGPRSISDEPSARDIDATNHKRPTVQERTVALLEVLICSDYPTQIALGATFYAVGYMPQGADGHLRIGYILTLSALDTALLIALIVFFLRAHGESPRELFLGGHGVAPEVVLGLPLTLVALAIALSVLATVQIFAPSLHTVEHNPLQDLIHRRRDAWLFAVVVVVAGGVREEIQRAFLLRRFEVWLGGGVVGVVVASIAFGAGHVVQGVDAMIATGLLGAFWGIVYLRRRSVIAPMVSHSGFNLLQIVQYLVLGR